MSDNLAQLIYEPNPLSKSDFSNNYSEIILTNQDLKLRDSNVRFAVFGAYITPIRSRVSKELKSVEYSAVMRDELEPDELIDEWMNY
jgi:hypothetical protein